jgi:hypothetical protein
MFCGCALQVQLTPEEKAYLKRVQSTPLRVSVHLDEDQQAWGRAQTFVAKYSPFRIQTATDFVLQTYHISDRVSWSYSITRSPGKSDVIFEVACTPTNSFLSGDYASRNAHILAHYIKTGELPYPHLIHKSRP